MYINDQEVRKYILDRLKAETKALSNLAKDSPEEYAGITPIDSLRDTFKAYLAPLQEGGYDERRLKRALEILKEETIEEIEEKLDREPFTGLSDEEKEERYRQHYEWSKKHNRLDKKIVRETKFKINETKKGYKDAIKIIIVCVFLYGLANVLGKLLDDFPDWIGIILEVPLILGGLVLSLWLLQIMGGDSEK
ncbi:MAG: hypothetical protein Q7U88_01835 [Desulfocapsaceae bacterium]|nr:hypothetical protein [Desulfocapsaceae bacterium]